MANFDKTIEIVKDPTDAGNICFSRFIGRNYYWGKAVDTAPFSMIPVLPKNHPIDTSHICAPLPAPYQHPRQSHGLFSTSGWDSILELYHPNNYPSNLSHAKNINGYAGTLQYHVSTRFGGLGKEGNVLGTHSSLYTVNILQASVVVSPGLVNAFAEESTTATEQCINWFSEYTKEQLESYEALSVPGFIDSWKKTTNKVGCCNFKSAECGNDPDYPGCCFLEDGTYKESWPTQCNPPGIPCIVYKSDHPDYLSGCDHTLHPDSNCNEDGTPIVPDKPCLGRYICGIDTEERKNISSQNTCYMYISKRICDGWTGDTPPVCPPGSGATCTGKYIGNFCGYSKSDNTQEGSESPNEKEGRNSAFLFFPPLHITTDHVPEVGEFNSCSGVYMAESCCLWTEDDLGEFAVSGKNWLPSWTNPTEHGNYNTTMDYAWRESADKDCSPLLDGYSANRRKLLVNPYIEYKGLCRIYGCNGGAYTYVCSNKTESECSEWTGPEDIDELLPPEDGCRSEPRWFYERTGLIPGDIKYTCEWPPEGGSDDAYCCTNPEASCYINQPCNQVVHPRIFPIPPTPAEPKRGKMICIENLLPDPEFSTQIQTIDGMGITLGWQVQLGSQTDCEALKDYLNETYYTKENVCSWVNGFDEYKFTHCRKTLVGERAVLGDGGLGEDGEINNVPYGCDDQMKVSGECCTCFRSWSAVMSGVDTNDITFKSACMAANGKYRFDSRCPHGPNQSYLKDKFNGNDKLSKSYKTHCRQTFPGSAATAKFGPMTCATNKTTYPDWNCPPLKSVLSKSFPNETECGDIFDPGGDSGVQYYSPPTDGSWSEVSAGDNFSVALKSNSGLLDSGNIIIWGTKNQPNLYNPPQIQALTVSVSNSHILAIENETNMVYAWGDNDSGQLAIHGITGAVKVAASSGWGTDSGFSIAIKKDNNTLVVWGDNSFPFTGETAIYSIKNVPIASNCTNIVAADEFAYAICDGNVIGWGFGTTLQGITGATEIACIQKNYTIDVDDIHIFTLHPTGVTIDGDSQVVSRVRYSTPSSQFNYYSPPVLITEQGSNPRIDIKQISCGWAHCCARDISGKVYCWGSSIYDPLDQNLLFPDTRAKTNNGDCTDHPAHCGVTNDYTYVSAGKGHNQGILTYNTSFADANDTISGWGHFDSIVPTDPNKEHEICTYFVGFELSSGVTLDGSACGLCQQNGNTYSFNESIIYSKDFWALSGNPFDPIGYVGIAEYIIWENSCELLGDIPEHGLRNYGANYENYYVFQWFDGKSYTLPGPSTRSSGGDGHCRSHLGHEIINKQSFCSGDNDAPCTLPGQVGCWPKAGGEASFWPWNNTEEMTYSGPCWPCPQLYDSLGSEKELFDATHGVFSVPGKLPDSYKIEIGLFGDSPWHPCVWGSTVCQNPNLGVWCLQSNIKTGPGIDEEFASSDVGSHNIAVGCCTTSSPGYYDQILVTDPSDRLRACPDTPPDVQCWRCPGWNIQYNTSFPNSAAWDGLTASDRYYKFAVNQWEGSGVLPADSIIVPWVSTCTIMEPNNIDGPIFVGITSAVGSGAAGRTMCWCQTTRTFSGANMPDGPNIDYIDTAIGGPGCTFSKVCNDFVGAQNSYCTDITWDDDCKNIAIHICPACAARSTHQECQNYHALKWCADKYNGKGGWTGGETIGLDLFSCDLNDPYSAIHPEITRCESCMKCDLPLCRHKYNCNLKCPCGTYGIDCQPTCEDFTGSYGPYVQNKCGTFWPGELNVF